MQDTVFIINGRFLVDVARSGVLDKISGENNRLEPRLMKLLHLLTAQQGQVVKREFIIKEIWDDYPGANEGLNQAISFLRKLLADEHKVIIQTQPKVGYSFHGLISQVGKPQPKRWKKKALITAGALVLVVLLFFAANIYLQKKSSRGRSRIRNDAEISRRDSIHQAEQMKRFSRDASGPASR